MKMRLLLPAAGVVALLVACWLLGRERAPAAPSELAPAPQSTPTSTPPIGEQGAASDARTELTNEPRAATAVATPPAATADAAFDESPPQVTPWLARLVVVDDDEHPVADA